jgi:type IV pilus assembly protein PilM
MRQHNSIGVDVSDTSIKVLLLDIHDEVIAYGTNTLEKGVVENGNIIDKKAFAEALSSVLRNTEPLVLDRSRVNLRAIVSMPESKLFTHTVAVPSAIVKKDIDQYVKDAAQTIIPHNFDDLYYDFYVRDTHESKTAVFVGVLKHELDNYIEAFSQAGVKPVFVGGELFSLGRALLTEEVRGKGCMILDIGTHGATLGVYLEDAIANASIVIREGGESFTAAISESLAVSQAEAETLKRTHGVKGGGVQGVKVQEVLEEPLRRIAQAVKEARSHFQSKYAVPIDALIVAGREVKKSYCIYERHSGYSFCQRDRTCALRSKE